jgi:hypothetical protein
VHLRCSSRADALRLLAVGAMNTEDTIECRVVRGREIVVGDG